ncbi:hypothetical protein [Schaalia sp. lx-260]|uniref:hypothetical protein n=1 Tax=Schaalia sp. lx-260 TaxID=2899082 RepID=UPI001E440C75|nr:hypothetical protein [Schaalia sp. lx-260]MCD4549677.1 hypothetical protein [Schaalia sp. lx-260]
MNTEALIIQHLSRHLAEGVKAYAQIPATRPPTFVTVERTGGARTHLDDTATLAIQAWAPTRRSAAALADEVASIVMRAWELPQVGRVSVESVYNFPDPASACPRYQLTVVVSVFPGA